MRKSVVNFSLLATKTMMTKLVLKSLSLSVLESTVALYYRS